MKSSLAFALLVLSFAQVVAHAEDTPVSPTASAPVYSCVSQDDGHSITSTDPDQCLRDGYFVEGLVDTGF